MNARAMTLLLLIVVPIAAALEVGCRDAGDGNDNGVDNVNDNSAFSLEDAVETMITDLQRAADCGGINPVLTEEQLNASLIENHALQPSDVTFEAFVLEQVEIIAMQADIQCAVQGLGNQNSSDNDNTAS